MKLPLNTHFYSLLLALFFLDTYSYVFFEQQLVMGLLCLYIMHLLKPYSYIRMSSLSLGLLLESCIYFNSLTPTLIYLIPLTVAGILIQHMMYITPGIHYLLLGICIWSQSFLIDPYLFHTASPPLLYTIMKLCVNIVIMIIFSLKYSGRQGNRFQLFAGREESPDS